MRVCVCVLVGWLVGWLVGGEVGCVLCLFEEEGGGPSYLEVHGYLIISRAISRATLHITHIVHIAGLITPRTTTHEPPSR